MKRLLFAAAIAATMLANVHAAAYPEKPITAIVPFPPGGSTDTIARAISPGVQAALGQMLVVPAAHPANSVQDLVAQLKKNPDKVTFASSGSGSSDHLTTALFWQKTATSGLHVPYKGGAPAITDLIGGHADASFQNINAVINHIKAGKLKALAITSEKRSPLLPQVPTLDESGIKDVNVYSWQGIAAPKGLPADVKAKLHGAIVGALNGDEVKKRLTEQGFEVVADSPADFAKFQAQELARWKQVIEVGKIVAD
ncbi:MAG: tripartite tricarboxylate transporter substrate binding protein [Oxalobacteraceae bacterium]|nr:MAG: tripartite tricarboxylate transporter substrate binding protein [Oxalobacteraceae bacterium]